MLPELPEGVFFSPLQRLQRDVSVAVLRWLAAQRALGSQGEGLRVLDAMTGCGVRAIRYALEVDARQALLLWRDG